MAGISSFSRALAVAATISCTALPGCGIASAPIKNAPRVVATPRSGELTITSQATDSIGDVTPVYVSIANGTDTSRSIVPSQIFALDRSGSRVAPLPPGEAARQAGGAGKLKAVLTSAAVSGAAVGAVGAAVGAIAGAALGAPGTGAAVGGAAGVGSGIVHGATLGQSEARIQAREQLNSLALPGGEVRNDFTVSGYVFFPTGDYREIEMLMVNGETGNTEVIRQPWR